MNSFSVEIIEYIDLVFDGIVFTCTGIVASAADNVTDNTSLDSLRIVCDWSGTGSHCVYNLS